ncbi:MAG: nucleoside 2-deoxyribosyltransferase domain-containing protein, partial [Pseudomonadota bacterium]|nr:nucleoside 2-deoxyribosyltransferase domain-containing protein [Pseudomonadota bacterium]
PNFRQQVEWELAALEQADLIFIYFAAGSHSPISLLELGLHAQSGKLIIVCPEGFWKKGNVDIVAHRFGLPVFKDLNAGLICLKQRIVGLPRLA